MLKKLAITAALVSTGYYFGRHHDYFVACAKFGWNEPEQATNHPWLTAENIYNQTYKKS